MENFSIHTSMGNKERNRIIFANKSLNLTSFLNKVEPCIIEIENNLHSHSHAIVTSFDLSARSFSKGVLFKLECCMLSEKLDGLYLAHSWVPG